MPFDYNQFAAKKPQENANGVQPVDYSSNLDNVFAEAEAELQKTNNTDTQVPHIDAPDKDGYQLMQDGFREQELKLASGFNYLNRAAASVPEGITRAASVITNPVAKLFGIPEYEPNTLSKTIGLDKVDNYLVSERDKYQKEIKQINPYTELGVVNAIKENNYKAAFRNLAGGVLESLPASVALMTLPIAGVGVPGQIGFSTALFGSGKLKELDEVAPDLPEEAKVINATVNGALEGIFETLFGSGAISSSLNNILKKEGLKQGEKIIGNGVRQVFSDLLTKYPALSPFGEMYEEMATQVTQNITDKLTGVDPEKPVTEGMWDAGILGFTSGGLHGGMIAGTKAIANRLNKHIEKKQARANIEANLSPITNAKTGNVHAVKLRGKEKDEDEVYFVVDVNADGFANIVDRQGNKVLDSEGKPYQNIEDFTTENVISREQILQGELQSLTQEQAAKEQAEAQAEREQKELAQVPQQLTIPDENGKEQKYVFAGEVRRNNPEKPNEITDFEVGLVDEFGEMPYDIAFLPAKTVYDYIKSQNESNEKELDQVLADAEKEVSAENSDQNGQNVTTTPSEDNNLSGKEVKTFEIEGKEVKYTKNEDYFEILPTEKMPLNKAASILQKKYKDSKKYEVEVIEKEVTTPEQIIPAKHELEEDEIIPASTKIVTESVKILPKGTLEQRRKEEQESKSFYQEQKKSILIDALTEFNATPESRSDKQKASEIEALATKLGYMTDRSPMNEIRIFNNKEGYVNIPKTAQPEKSGQINQLQPEQPLVDSSVDNVDSSQSPTAVDQTAAETNSNPTEAQANEKLNELNNRKTTTEEKFRFLESLPKGSVIQSNPETRIILGEKQISSRGTETFELIPQIFNDETGEWEDNPSALQLIYKNKNGEYNSNGDFTEDFRPSAYTDIKTGERKIDLPKITFPQQIKTQNNQTIEQPIEEKLPETQQEISEQQVNTPETTQPKATKPPTPKQIERAKLLKSESNSAREVILKYFLSGGKVSPEMINRESIGRDRTGKLRSEGERRSMFWVTKQGEAKYTDQLEHILHGTPWEKMLDDPTDFSNEVLDVLSLGTPSNMMSELKRLQSEQGSFDQQYSPEQVSEIEALAAQQAERERLDYEEQLQTVFEELFENQNISEQEIVNLFYTNNEENGNDQNEGRSGQASPEHSTPTGDNPTGSIEADRGNDTGEESQNAEVNIQNNSTSENNTSEKSTETKPEKPVIQEETNISENKSLPKNETSEKQSGDYFTEIQQNIPTNDKIKTLEDKLARQKKLREQKVKNMNERNGVLGDAQADPRQIDLFAETFAPTQENFQKAIDKVDAEINSIQKDIDQERRVLLTAARENKGQLEIDPEQVNNKRTEKETEKDIPTSPDGKYQIYEYKVKNNDDGIDLFYGVPSVENKGIKGFGDDLFKTIKEAVKQVEYNRTEGEKLFLERQKEKEERELKRQQEETEKQAKSEANKGKTKLELMNEAKNEKILNKQLNYEGNIKTRKQFIEEAVRDGKKFEIGQENKIKDVTRSAYNRMNGREQEEFDRRQKEAGLKNVYKVVDTNGTYYEITKAEYDYAILLLSQQTAPEKDIFEQIQEVADRNKAKKEIVKAEAEVNTNPTEAQKEAGNYKKGNVTIQGLDITIENPKGSIRSGVDKTGKPWSVTMNNTYGYFKRTKGKDGDQIDVFLGDNPLSEKVFVIDQNKEDGSFDESKVMLGFDSADQAQSDYMKNYSSGWKGFGAITESSIDDFKKWLNDGARQNKAYSEYVENKYESTIPDNPKNKFVNTEKLIQHILKNSSLKIGEEYTNEDGEKYRYDKYTSNYTNTPYWLSVLFYDAAKENGSEYSNQFSYNDYLFYFDRAKYKGQMDKKISISKLILLDKEQNQSVEANEKVEEVANKNKEAINRLNSTLSQYGWTTKQDGNKIALINRNNKVVAYISGTDNKYSITDIDGKKLLNGNNGIENGAEKVAIEYFYAKKDENKPAIYGANNKIVSNERAEELKKRLRDKLNNLNVGFDPELLAIGTELAAYHIESGARKFADFSKKMIEDVGDAIKPYLKAIYNGARDIPGMEAYEPEMTEYSEVKNANVDELLKPSTENNVQKNKLKENGKQRILQGNNKRAPKPASPSLFDRVEGEQRTGGSIKLQSGEILGTNGEQQQPTGREGNLLPRNADLLEPALVEFNADENDTKSFNPTQKYNDNIAAIETVISLIREKRAATPQEKETLSKYVGFGGLKDVVLNPEIAEGWKPSNIKYKPQVKRIIELANEFNAVSGAKDSLGSITGSILNAHFTPSTVIHSVYDGLKKLGFKGGQILEPSAGIGNFVTFMPNQIKSNSTITAVELDDLTGNILKYLHDDVNVKVSGIQDANIPNNSQDLVISNVPFGNYKIFDKAFKGVKEQFQNRIHNYFFAKAVDMAREGGLIAFVTSKGVMDAPGNEQLRKYLDQNTDFLGAVRLPNNAFKNNANTEVVTDIIFLKKNTTGTTNNIDFVSVKEVEATHKDGEKQNVTVNNYFIKNPQNMLGDIVAGGLYSRDDYTVENKKDYDLSAAITKALPKDVYTPTTSGIGLQANDSQETIENIPNIQRAQEAIVEKNKRDLKAYHELLEKGTEWEKEGELTQAIEELKEVTKRLTPVEEAKPEQTVEKEPDGTITPSIEEEYSPEPEIKKEIHIAPQVQKEPTVAKLLPVEEFRHTKTGQILYNVKINGRSDEYSNMVSVAKKYNPYGKQKPYNTFSKGFLFEKKEDAENFKNEVNNTAFNQNIANEPYSPYQNNGDVVNDGSETYEIYRYFESKFVDYDLVLLKQGDFYEALGNSALNTSSVLGTVMTRRNDGKRIYNVTGFPSHSLETYLPKLRRSGLSVIAIDENGNIQTPSTNKTSNQAEEVQRTTEPDNGNGPSTDNVQQQGNTIPKNSNGKYKGIKGQVYQELKNLILTHKVKIFDSATFNTLFNKLNTKKVTHLTSSPYNTFGNPFNIAYTIYNQLEDYNGENFNDPKELGFDEEDSTPLFRSFPLTTNEYDTPIEAAERIVKAMNQRAEMVKGVADRLSNELNTPIIVVRNETMLPRNLQRQVKKQGAKRSVMGVYNPTDGKIYLVSNNIPSELEAEKTVLHEIVGHKGLRGLLGAKEHRKLMEMVWNSLTPAQKADLNRRLGNLDPLILADEYMAELAEQNSTPKWYEKVLAKLREMLRKVFPNLRLNNTELKTIIRKSYEALKRPAPEQFDNPLDFAEALSKHVKNTNEPAALFRTAPQQKEEGSDLDIENKSIDRKKQRIQDKIEQTPNESETHKKRTILKQKIKDLESGWKSGEVDTKAMIWKVQTDVIEYAKKNMPFDKAGKAEINRLLRLVRYANNPKHLETVLEKIDTIVSGLDIELKLNNIDKILHDNIAKNVNGKPQGTLDPKVYLMLDKVRAIRKLKGEDEIDQYVDSLNEDDIEGTTLFSVFGNLEEKTRDEINDALDKLISIVSTGKVWYYDQLQKRKKINDGLRAMVLDKVSGGQGLVSELDLISSNSQVKTGAIGRFINSHINFEWLLDKISKDKSEETGKGKMQEYFGDVVTKATNDESKGIREQTDFIHKKASEIFGVDGSKLAKKFHDNTKVIKKSGVTYINREGKRVEIPLSQNQAYKKWMEWQDKSLSETFKTMGWDETTRKELDKFIFPDVKEWAEWQLKEYYPGYYEGINQKYNEAYFANLGRNENYSPIRREVVSPSNVEDAMMQKPNVLASVGNQSLKTRKSNINNLLLVDGDSMLAQHIAQMEHFKAWVMPINQLRSVFSSREVQKAIKNNHGVSVLSNLNNQIADMARGGEERANIIDFVDKVRRNFVTAELGANISLFPKQSVSLLAYLSEVPVKNYVTGMLDLALHLRKAIGIIKSNEMVTERFQKGWAPEIRAAMKQDTPGALSQSRNILGNLRNILLFPTKMGDYTAVIGGWVVYKYHYDEQIAKGKSEEQAHDYALNQLDRSVSRTQQSGALKDVSQIQKGSWNKVLTMFKSSPIQQFRYENAAFRNLINGRGSVAQNAKIIALYHIIMPVMFQLISNLFTDDDDDKERNRLLRAGVLGSFNSLMVVGDIIESVLEKIMGESWGDYSATPLEGSVTKGLQGVGNISSGIKDLDKEKILKGVDQLIYGINNIGVGLPYRPVKKLIKQGDDILHPENVKLRKAEEEYKKIKKEVDDWTKARNKAKNEKDFVTYRKLSHDDYMFKKYTSIYGMEDFVYGSEDKKRNLEKMYKQDKISEAEYIKKLTAIYESELKTK